MKSVVICGSRRFIKEIRVFENTLPSDLKRYAFLGLTLHHLEYIRKANDPDDR